MAQGDGEVSINGATAAELVEVLDWAMEEVANGRQGPDLSAMRAARDNLDEQLPDGGGVR